ncbi:VanZ family protein [Candidatus Pacearchaeota archaeon]|nr:VanZ family protein [Candidatus Pacearchaeota archaeon]
MIGYLEKNKRFSIIFMVLMAVEIFVISSIPGRDFPAVGIDPSLAYHLIVFFLFNFFLILSIIGKKNVKVKYLVLSIVFSIIYAVLDEIHQFFVPLRLPSVRDVLIDAAGVSLSTITYLYYKRKI